MRKRFCFLIILTLFSCTQKEEFQKFILVEANEFNFGNDEGNENESPSVPIKMKSFYLSETEVSVEQFMNFVKATNYITEAEIKGESAVFVDTSWQLVREASWKSPFGKNANFEEIKNLPVVHVTFADAKAYCDWVGGRLPSEVELEYALKQSAQKKMNIWSGDFPSYNDSEDGFKTYAPVKDTAFYDGTFYHLKGNVWEWTADIYHYEIHDKLAFQKKRYQGAYKGSGFNLEDQTNANLYHVIKGGSYLCNKCYCAGYRPEARQKARKDESFSHVGFRVAKDVE